MWILSTPFIVSNKLLIKNKNYSTLHIHAEVTVNEPGMNVSLVNVIYFQSTCLTWHPQNTHSKCFYWQGICKYVFSDKKLHHVTKGVTI